MSYEYFLTVERLGDAADPEAEFLSSFRRSPHALYKSDTEIVFKELLDAAPGQQYDVRLARLKRGLILQVNRRCDVLFELFSNALADAVYFIHEEDEDESVPLSEVFRLR